MTEGQRLLLDASRLLRSAQINHQPKTRPDLESEYGQVWDTDQIRTDFEVHAFMAPFVVATRKSDGKLGSLEFQVQPRLYFNWQEDTVTQ